MIRITTTAGDYFLAEDDPAEVYGRIFPRTPTPPSCFAAHRTGEEVQDHYFNPSHVVDVSAFEVGQ